MAKEEIGPGVGFVVVTKFEKKLKEGSGKIGPDGKIAPAEYEHQPILLNAKQIVAVEKVTVVSKEDRMSMDTGTFVKMFGQSDVLCRESLEEIIEMLEDCNYTVRRPRCSAK